jgi:hypothetical protein
LDEVEIEQDDRMRLDFDGPELLGYKINGDSSVL